MEKLPSTLVIHKKADGVDTRFAMTRGPFLHSLLEKWLGALNQGTYQQAQGDARWAFEPISDLWPTKEVESDSEDETQEPAKDVREQGHSEVDNQGESRQQRSHWTDHNALDDLYHCIQMSKE